MLNVPLERESKVPLFKQLYDGVREAILSGQLRPGTRLPSTRLLADELALSRNTIMLAFEQLLIEGYLDGKAGSGTFVAEELPEKLLRAERGPRKRPRLATPRRMPTLSHQGEILAGARVEAGLVHSEPLAFCPALPALDAFPYETWGRLVSRRWRRDAGRLLGYGELAGYRPLREAIADYVASARSVRCTAEQVIITAGAQQALDLTARTLLDEGDNAWLEDPGYLGARSALRGAGARVVPVPVDDAGLIVEAGVEACERARVAFVSPSHQYPLGVTMSLPRRLALLDWAYRNGSWIVEDDYDSEYRYNSRPLASLQGLDTAGHVIYVGTFSKVLFPALRLGYVIAPPGLVDSLVRARAISDRHPPVLDQAVVADFMNEGHFTSHIRRMRELYAERLETLLEAAARELGGLLEVARTDAGMHTLGWLPAGWSDAEASAAAAEHHIEAIALSEYSLSPVDAKKRSTSAELTSKRGQPADSVRAALIMGFASIEPTRLRAAVRQLAAVLRKLRRSH
jgi:GntR family transcriptional regulator/MocR family aminotransferase